MKTHLLRSVLFFLLATPSILAQKVVKQEFHENGEVFLELFSFPDSDTLLQKVYFESGNLSVEYQLLNGLRNGYAKSFDVEGKLRISEQFKKDVLHGSSRTFHLNGKISGIRHYKNGNHIDTSTFFNEDGDTLKQLIYLEPCPFGKTSCLILHIQFAQNTKAYSYRRTNKKEIETIYSQTLYELLQVQERSIPMIEKGRKIFRANCSMCHKMEIAMIGPPLRDITKTKTQTEILEVIEGKNNHNKTKLTEEEKKQLIEFLKMN